MNRTQYIFENSIKNLIRNKSRYILCGLFLLCTVSVLACALYFSVSIDRYITEMQGKYLSRLNLKFREELQWMGDEYNYNGAEIWIKNGTEVIFNSDGSMDKYNIPVYIQKEFYEQFNQSQYVKEYMLAYTENVYGIYNIASGDESERLRETFAQYRNTNFMYGGSFDDFSFMFSSNNKQEIEFSITDGNEHGIGECLLYEDTAKQCGYKIGDYITYYDDNGNEGGQLKISGFFIAKRNGAKISDEFDSLKIYGTNPFFRNTSAFIKYMVITNFDTVYNVYGDEHEINKYIAWYIIDDPKNFDSFVQECGEYDYSGMIGFYPDTSNYERSVEIPNQITRIAWIFTLIMLVLSALILILTALYILRERRREIGINYALGATKKKILLTFLYENLIFISFVTIVSVGTGWILAKIFSSFNSAVHKLAISYVPTLEFLFILAVFSLFINSVSVIVVSIYISKSSPSELISAKD